MTEQEAFIGKLAETTGTEIVLAADGSCDFVVNDTVITAMYQATAHEWLLVATVLDADEAALPPESLSIVLKQSLFGRGTLGFMPGLYANAIVLSGTMAADDVTVDLFVARCELLAKACARMAAKLNGLPDEPVDQDEEKTDSADVVRYDV